jgi:hypothetical protein
MLLWTVTSRVGQKRIADWSLLANLGNGFRCGLQLARMRASHAKDFECALAKPGRQRARDGALRSLEEAEGYNDCRQDLVLKRLSVIRRAVCGRTLFLRFLTHISIASESSRS